MAKINVDAAICRRNDKGACAAICRDESCRYLGASVTCVDSLTDPENLEAHACCEGLSLAGGLYLQQFRLTTDCLATVNHLKGCYLGPSAMIIRDVKSILKQFEKTEIVHEAHDLAKAASSLVAGRHVWLTVTPDIIFVPDNIEL